MKVSNWSSSTEPTTPSNRQHCAPILCGVTTCPDHLRKYYTSAENSAYHRDACPAQNEHVKKKLVTSLTLQLHTQFERKKNGLPQGARETCLGLGPRARLGRSEEKKGKKICPS